MKNKFIYIYNNEVIMYLLIGGATTLINILTKYIFLFTFLNPNDALQLQLAVILSWIISIIFAYVSNRKYVFKSKEKNKLKEAFNFVISRLLTLVLEMILMWFLINLLKLNTNNLIIIITLIVQILIIILNYLFSKFYVFNNNNLF